MLQKLSNTNGCGESAVANKKIQDLCTCVDVIQEQVDHNTDNIETNANDIQDIKQFLDDGTFTNNVSGSVVEARDRVVTDRIASQFGAPVEVCGGITTDGIEADVVESKHDVTADNGNVSLVATAANVVTAVACAENAVCKAEEAIQDAAAVQDNLDQHIVDVSNQVTTKCLISDDSNIGDAQASTMNIGKSTIAELTAELQNVGISKFDGKFFEPTAKDPTDYYQIFLPNKFQGRAKFVGVDEFGQTLFSAVFDTSFSSTNSNDREGTALVLHSGLSKYDFYQVLRRRDLDQLSFITQSNVKRIYYNYVNLDKDNPPTYDIYPNLTDDGPDYTLYNTIYTAEHSDQIVVLGNEDTLNGGLTVFGTFYATAFEVPETEVANVRVKHQIYGGFNCNTGEYETCGTPGGIITYNSRTSTLECNVSWINGCPRQVLRKGACYDQDGYGNECSYLQFETVKTKDPVTNEFKPALDTDLLFDEVGLASYKGETASNTFPIVHLGDDSTVHGDIEVVGDATIDGKTVTSCIESDDPLNITAPNVTTNAECIYDFADDVLECVSNGKTVNAVCHITNAENVAVNVIETLGISACCGTAVQGGLTVDDITITGKIKGFTCTDSDFNVGGQLAVENDLTVHGDLYVQGTVVATCEKQVSTSSDYVTLREGVNCPLGNNEYSGLAVNNYQANKMATMAVDNSGEWRISAGVNAVNYTYIDISNYKNVWYNNLSQTTTTVVKGITKSAMFIELDEVALDSNNEYYHKSGVDWFGPISIVNSKFDIGDLVTSAAKIAELELLTTDDLVYYNSLVIAEIDPAQNQPLLTRNEITCFNDNDLLTWDATNCKATNAVRPTLNDQIFTAKIDPLTNAVTYCWKDNEAGSVCRYATRACAMAAIAIQEGCAGYVPDNALIVIDNEVSYTMGEDR